MKNAIETVTEKMIQRSGCPLQFADIPFGQVETDNGSLRVNLFQNGINFKLDNKDISLEALLDMNSAMFITDFKTNL